MPSMRLAAALSHHQQWWHELDTLCESYKDVPEVAPFIEVIHECLEVSFDFKEMMHTALRESDDPDPRNVAHKLLDQVPDRMLRIALAAVLPMAMEGIVVEQREAHQRTRRTRPRRVSPKSS